MSLAVLVAAAAAEGTDLAAEESVVTMPTWSYAVIVLAVLMVGLLIVTRLDLDR